MLGRDSIQQEQKEQDHQPGVGGSDNDPGKDETMQCPEIVLDKNPLYAFILNKNDNEEITNAEVTEYGKEAKDVARSPIKQMIQAYDRFEILFDKIVQAAAAILAKQSMISPDLETQGIREKFADFMEKVRKFHDLMKDNVSYMKRAKERLAKQESLFLDGLQRLMRLGDYSPVKKEIINIAFTNFLEAVRKDHKNLSLIIVALNKRIPEKNAFLREYEGYIQLVKETREIQEKKIDPQVKFLETQHMLELKLAELQAQLSTTQVDLATSIASNRELTAKLETAKTTEVRLQSELKSVQANAFEEASQTIADLTGQIEGLHAEETRKTALLAEQKDEISRLTQLKQQHDLAKLEMKEQAEVEIARLKIELEHAQQAIQDLHAELGQQNTAEPQHVSDEGQQNDALAAADAENTVSALRAQVRELQELQEQSKHNQQSLLEEREQIIAALKTNLATTQEELSKSSAQNMHLAGELQQSQATYAHLESELKQAEEKIGNAEEQVQTFIQKIAALEAENSLQNENTQRLTAQLSDLQAEHKQQTEVLRQANEQLQRVTEEKERVEVELKGLQTQLAKSQQTEQEALAQVHVLQQQLSESSAQNMHLSGELQQSQATLAHLESKLKQAEEKVGNAAEQAQTFMQKIATLEAENGLQKANTQKLTTQLSDLQAENKQQTEALHQANEQLQTATQEKGRVEAALKVLQAQLTESQQTEQKTLAQVNVLEQQAAVVPQLEQKIAALEAEASANLDKIATEKQEVSRLRSKLAASEEKAEQLLKIQQESKPEVASDTEISLLSISDSEQEPQIKSAPAQEKGQGQGAQPDLERDFSFKQLQKTIMAEVKHFNTKAQSCFGINNAKKAKKITAAWNRAASNFASNQGPLSVDELLRQKINGQESIVEALSYHRIGFFGKTSSHERIFEGLKSHLTVSLRK